MGAASLRAERFALFGQRRKSVGGALCKADGASGSCHTGDCVGSLISRKGLPEMGFGLGLIPFFLGLQFCILQKIH
jgi:hypothetical protein